MASNLAIRYPRRLSHLGINKKGDTTCSDTTHCARVGTSELRINAGRWLPKGVLFKPSNEHGTR
jgi:hypothetical protein